MILALGAVVLTTGGAAAQPPDDPPTFARDIAQIIYGNCAECHRPKQAGPFSLLTYEDARQRARQIAHVTQTGFMPPWLPEHGYGDFVDERRLTPEQVDLIQQWVKAGAPEGNPARTPPIPQAPDEWPQGSPERVITMPEAFEVPADGPDIYRNFVVAAPIEETFYVRGWHFRPGNPRAVHHAFVLVDRSGNARALDAEDPGPGYDGMLEAELDGLDGFINGWAPGKGPVMEREGMAWRLEPGDDLVFQIHMQPTGKREDVQASIGLYRRELPPTLHPAIIYLGSRSIDIPPGESAYTLRDDFLLPVDVDALAVVPHAHYVGRRMECHATLPDGSRKWLIRIDDWDLTWQGTFQYEQPVFLPRGSRIITEFLYDNSASNPRNPSHPPQRVRYGPNATDEMCEMWLQVLPRDPAARPRLEEAVSRHFTGVVIAGLEHLLEREPESAAAHRALAARSRSAGNVAKAVLHFRKVAELEPDSAAAHLDLADALAARGRMPEALRVYERALDLDPQHEVARFNYANALRKSGQAGKAARQYRRVLEQNERSSEARHNLAVTLTQLGRFDEALHEARELTRIEPNVAIHHYSLGILLLEVGEAEAGVQELERALQLDPEALRPKLHLAWVLATHPQAAVRDGARARALAQEAVADSPSDPLAHDVLAAACAELGRYEDACGHAEKALELAEGEGRRGLAQQIHRRLGSYRRHSPFRDE